MKKLQKFNKITAIAPSDILQSEIDVDRYSDRIADIYYGFLDPKSETETEQIFLMSGYMEALVTGALRATESVERMSQRLQDAYRIPAERIISYTYNSEPAEVPDDTSTYMNDSFIAGSKQYPEFFREVIGKKREMGLIADELQMSLGRDALGALNIRCAEFQVVTPLFGKGSGTMDVIQSPISINTHRDLDEYELAIAGDS